MRCSVLVHEGDELWETVDMLARTDVSTTDIEGLGPDDGEAGGCVDDELVCLVDVGGRRREGPYRPNTAGQLEQGEG